MAIQIRVYVAGVLVGEGEVPGPLVARPPKASKRGKGGKRGGR